MKYFILHGDDSEKSYDRLKVFIDSAKKRNWEIVYLDESSFTLMENLSASSLFNGERFYVHRNFKKIKKNDIEFLAGNGQSYDGNLTLYSDTPISAAEIKKFPKDTKVEEFKLPVIVWKFLDSIYPGNLKEVVTILHKILEREPAEKLLGLISWHLRDLYWVKKDPSGYTNQDWKLGRLKTQALKFKGNALEELIINLANADVTSKTTQSDLNELLDFVLLSNLQ